MKIGVLRRLLGDSRPRPTGNVSYLWTIRYIAYCALLTGFPLTRLDCRSKPMIFVFSDIVVYGTMSVAKGVVYETP